MSNEEYDNNEDQDSVENVVPTIENKKNSKTVGPNDTVSQIYENLISTDKNLKIGIDNIGSIPELDKNLGIPGKKFEKGVIGFRRVKSHLMLAIACGKAQVRYIDLQKFVAMIEKMDDPKSSTIMLLNFQDQEDNRASKGQILGRFNAKNSAIHIIQGLAGRVIRNPSDIALFDVYYLDRVDIMSFYLAAKAQLSNDDTLETMIATYDGWKAFNVPLDPLNPYED